MSIEKDMKTEHILFCNEYLKDFNGTRAYHVAYGDEITYETAAASASRLLKNDNIQTYLQNRITDRIERTEIEQDDVVKELAGIALADVTEVVNVSGNRIIIKDTKELPQYVRKSIKAIKPHRNGIELEFHDKTRALELLGRHLGMFDDRLTVESSQEERVAEVLEGIVNAVHGEAE